MAKAKDKKPVKYVQELAVTSPIGVEIIRTFDTAWHTMLDRVKQHGTPVTTTFVRLVRVD